MANKQQATNQDLAVLDESPKYLALSSEIDPAELGQVLQENLGGEIITAQDLDKIKVPSGESAAVFSWKGDAVKVLEGVIIGNNLRRAMWLDSLDSGAGRVPPACVSPDAQYGSRTANWIYQAAVENDLQEVDGVPISEPAKHVKDARQDCARCPFSQFGSSQRGGKGQWCQMKRDIFLALPGESMPVPLVVPATSLKPARAYLVSLTTSAIAASAIETKITLQKVKGQGTPDYFILNFERGQVFDKETRAKFKAYAESIRPFIMAASARLNEVIEPEETAY